ncbi:hypothetical protein, partial [Candidatus Venteria ishoeyi]|uniref:hypothetical protein n=1 Tax=Candidatus Venteria ishoeyi TaxID=1899563 RepID=UPI00255D157A
MHLRIPGFPPGTHTDSAGHTQEFSQERLQRAANVYDPALHKASIVTGHPSDDMEKAQGWIERLALEDRLTAYGDKLSGSMWDMLQNNQAEKYSFSFYLEDHPANPSPGNLYLRHVGVVPIPAIKDNPPAELQYSDDADCLTIQFKEETTMTVEETDIKKPTVPEAEAVDFAEMQKQLKDAQAELKAETDKLNADREALAKERGAIEAQKHADFAESLVSKGQILPKDKDDLVAF